VLYKFTLPLKSSVGYLADLLRVEPLPRLRVQVKVKRNDEDRVDEVDEGVPNVAVVLQVDGEVEEVPLAGVKPVNFFKQHLLRVLVGDVADHQGRPGVVAFEDVVEADHEGGVLRPLCRLLGALLA